MRQVPAYLLIGNGRVSRHFQHYFSLLQIPCEVWQREQPVNKLQEYIQQATHILILISDKAIEPFIQAHLQTSKALHIHFSGSLISDKAYGTHPLMTFSSELYSLEQYQAIPFIVDHDAPDFKTLLPGLANTHVRLNKSLKAKYHALCVLSGNFSCLLWQKLFTSFSEELHLPPAIAHPYLLQQTKNLLSNPVEALTGPLLRDDQQTIQKNLNALANDPFQAVYQSFVSCYQHMRTTR